MDLLILFMDLLLHMVDLLLLLLMVDLLLLHLMVLLLHKVDLPVDLLLVDLLLMDLLVDLLMVDLFLLMVDLLLLMVALHNQLRLGTTHPMLLPCLQDNMAECRILVLSRILTSTHRDHRGQVVTLTPTWKPQPHMGLTDMGLTDLHLILASKSRFKMNNRDKLLKKTILNL